MAGNITVAIVIILIIGGIIFGCWVDRADTKIADRKNEAASDKQTGSGMHQRPGVSAQSIQDSGQGFPGSYPLHQQS